MTTPVNGVTDPTLTAGTTNGGTLQPFANLDLTETQRTQIRSIFQNAKSEGLSQAQVQQQISAVLTPQQQQTFQTDVQNAQSTHSGRHHHHHGGGGSSSQSNADSITSSTPSATAPTNGLTETDVQNQVAAANSVILQQLQNEVGA